MNISEIEARFKEVTMLDPSIKLDIYPIIEHIGFNMRVQEKKQYSEVFTPLELVDKMLNISKPNPKKFNMDLCAGHGQFTVRMLRKFIEENPLFDIENYLKNLHWFNELNLESSKQIIYIFGDNINLAIGPAQELKNYPCDENKIWLKGIFVWENRYKKWVKRDLEELKNLDIETIENENILNSKQLF